MNRIGACGWVCLLVAGCQEPRVYQLDFSQEPNFQWDGKVRVTKVPHWRFGPFLIIDDYWTVDRIEFGSRDGRTACIDTEVYGADATVEPNLPTAHKIPGADITQGVFETAFILAGKSAKALAGGAYRTATQPAGPDLVQAIDGKSTTRPVPAELKPYAEHLDQLKQADWCAIALQPGNDMTVEYRVPDENLRIVIHGNPRKYGPGVLEVWTADGRLLKRFEQKQMPGNPGKTTVQSQPAASRPR